MILRCILSSARKQIASERLELYEWRYSYVYIQLYKQFSVYFQMESYIAESTIKT